MPKNIPVIDNLDAPLVNYIQQHLNCTLNCTYFVFHSLDFPHYDFLVVLAVSVAI